MRKIQDLKGLDEDGSFEKLVEETRMAADGEEPRAEQLLTETILKNFVRYHIDKAKKAGLNKGENGGRQQ
ncbi:hypothetical protein Tsubulata_032826 [Turnera subulata]|uniref:Uncharacterized protein n=1 Tax=Turnera subulata TaxID=218843 RepID=A0A9Q0J7B4_9ROSI|nr:hypothetical protein Tsubulata_032826 [Turnera subulata]